MYYRFGYFSYEHIKKERTVTIGIRRVQDGEIVISSLFTTFPTSEYTKDRLKMEGA